MLRQPENNPIDEAVRKMDVEQSGIELTIDIGIGLCLARDMREHPPVRAATASRTMHVVFDGRLGSTDLAPRQEFWTQRPALKIDGELRQLPRVE